MLYATSFFELKLPIFWLTADCFAWLILEREEPRNCFVFLINKIQHVTTYDALTTLNNKSWKKLAFEIFKVHNVR